MQRLLFFIIILTSIETISAQHISSKKWSDLFSYNNILAIKEDNGKIMAATENGIFYYNLTSGEITKLSKANGLHEVKITAFDYNPVTQTGLVGYKNGSMDVIAPDGITYIVDIPIATSFNGDKSINHISISDNKAVISADYGVSIFDLKKKEFAQSAFFMNGSNFEAANEATIKDNKVYVATPTGLKMHEINVTFPVYSTWQTVHSGNIIHVDSEGSLVFGTANNVFIESGSNFNQISQSFTDIADIVITGQNIIIADKVRVYVYSTSGNSVNSATFQEECNTANLISGKLYGGTKLSGLKNIENEIFKPDGPYNNRSYKIHLQEDKIWVSSGARTDRFNAAAPDPQNLGFYFFSGREWVYSSYFKENTTKKFNLLDVVPNPSDNTEVFFTNYVFTNDTGFYRMKYDDAAKDFVFQKYYNPVQTTVFANRAVGLTFDKNNSLFATLSFQEKSAGQFNTGIAFYDRAADKFIYKNVNVGNAVQKPLIYESQLWIPLPRTNEFLVYDYKNTPLNFSDDSTYAIFAENGLPANSNGSLSIAIDKNEDAWIGTNAGLRILNDAPNSIKNNPHLENIVIEQGGIAEELFRDGQILQVEADSGNQKWISVDGGGVFYLNANGEKTIKHFTRENSPLPTNSITDIKVDQKSGKVYFVTLDGIVVYQGDVADVTSGFGDVLVYPNPVVYSNFKGVVTIRGLAEKTNIRIVDTAGNLVHQAVARGGYYEWNLNNQRGNRVASGIYFVLMTNEDGTDKATAKIGVVN